MTDDEIKSLILRRRLQTLVHSCIYYYFDDNIISDAEWARRALELEELQKQYPKLSKEVKWYEAFKDFDHSTGSNLPITHPWVIGTARYLLDLRDKSNF